MTVKSTIRLADDTHRRAKSQAALDGVTLDAFIASALEYYLATAQELREIRRVAE